MPFKMKNDDKNGDTKGGESKTPLRNGKMNDEAAQQNPGKGSYSPASYGHVSAGNDVQMKGTKIERQGPSTLKDMGY